MFVSNHKSSLENPQTMIDQLILERSFKELEANSAESKDNCKIISFSAIKQSYEDCD